MVTSGQNINCILIINNELVCIKHNQRTESSQEKHPQNLPPTIPSRTKQRRPSNLLSPKKVGKILGY